MGAVLGWGSTVNWDEPDWDLLLSRVDHDLILSVADTPSLSIDKLTGSWLRTAGAWTMDIAPRPHANLTALSVAAEGWMKLNSYRGLHTWLSDWWHDEEPLVGVIREEGRGAEDVIRARFDVLLAEEPAGSIEDIFRQAFWRPTKLDGQGMVIPSYMQPAWTPLSFYGLKPDAVVRALGVPVGRAVQLLNGDSMLIWEESLAGILMNVLAELTNRADAPDYNAWLMTETRPGCVLADEIAVWEWESLLMIANYLPPPR